MPIEQQHRTNSPNETALFAARLAPTFISSRRYAEPWRIYLSGDVGVGKTLFVRALVQTFMGGRKRIPSPSYTLINTYDCPKIRVHHIDCYRMQGKPAGEDILECLNQNALSLVEWSERAAGMPEPHMTIHIESRGELARQFHFTACHYKTKQIIFAI